LCSDENLLEELKQRVFGGSVVLEKANDRLFLKARNSEGNKDPFAISIVCNQDIKK
jgi:hypothetical protein